MEDALFSLADVAPELASDILRLNAIVLLIAAIGVLMPIAVRMLAQALRPGASSKRRTA